jgi:hypothetical protein
VIVFLSHFGHIVAQWLKAGTMEPEEVPTASQWLVNILQHQQTCRPLLGNSLPDMSHNNRGTAGSSVFIAVCASDTVADHNNVSIEAEESPLLEAIT